LFASTTGKSRIFLFLIASSASLHISACLASFSDSSVYPSLLFVSTTFAAITSPIFFDEDTEETIFRVMFDFEYSDEWTTKRLHLVQ
jgi:hypothetical protein